MWSTTTECRLLVSLQVPAGLCPGLRGTSWPSIRRINRDRVRAFTRTNVWAGLHSIGCRAMVRPPEKDLIFPSRHEASTLATWYTLRRSCCVRQRQRAQLTIAGACRRATIELKPNLICPTTSGSQPPRFSETYTGPYVWRRATNPQLLRPSAQNIPARGVDRLKTGARVCREKKAREASSGERFAS